jgi:hypothetical protein
MKEKLSAKYEKLNFGLETTKYLDKKLYISKIS